MGYPQGIKGFRLYDIQNKRFFISRIVVFHENIFPFHQVTVHDDALDPFPDLVLPKSFNYDGFCSQNSATLPNGPPVASTASLANTSPDSIIGHNVEDACLDQPSTNINSNASLANTVPLNPRRSTRERRQPSYLKEFHCGLLQNGFYPSTASK
ncbi:hypothetical protein OC713_02595, partial [Sweet potato little leaf phytoplasma]|uniref:hypothetical protein n=1 Tax=Candidatus Phytoplasma australasiaticum TaxID=2754999 RepID=UPI002712703E